MAARGGVRRLVQQLQVNPTEIVALDRRMDHPYFLRHYNSATEYMFYSNIQKLRTIYNNISHELNCCSKNKRDQMIKY